MLLENVLRRLCQLYELFWMVILTAVRYDAGLNDFVAANYSHLNWDVLRPLLFQVALGLGIWWRRSKATPQPVKP